MEGRTILTNEDRIAVRLEDGSYSVFTLKTDLAVEIGDYFLGSLTSTGPQLLMHARSQQWVPVQIKLARSFVAAQTKRYLQKSPRFAK